jgi:hypothetical protein
LVAPAEWSERAVKAMGAENRLIVWAFVAEPQPHLRERRPPWLVIAGSESGPFGAERFAVPRLVPSCEWADKAEIDQWHELAMKGEAKPIATDETVTSALAAQPRRQGRRANPALILARRLDVVVACDLHQRPVADIADERLADYSKAKDPERFALRSVERDRQDGRRLLAEQGGLPWVAFPNGKLPEGWWLRGEFADALHQWDHHACQLAYRDRWEQLRGVLSPAQEVVYRFLGCQREGQRLRPESLTLAQAILEDDARASDAFCVEQWVVRLVLAARPGCPADPARALFDHPVLSEAWSRVHGDAGLHDRP